MTYQEQLKDPRWQKKRLEVLGLSNFECQNCGDKSKQLHVHHPYYRRGAMIWEYAVEELECLCDKCHKDAHALDEKIRRKLALNPNRERALGYISASNAYYWREEIPEYPVEISSWGELEGVFDFLLSVGMDNRMKLVDLYETIIAKNKVLDVIGINDAIVAFQQMLNSLPSSKTKREV